MFDTFRMCAARKKKTITFFSAPFVSLLRIAVALFIISMSLGPVRAILTQSNFNLHELERLANDEIAFALDLAFASVFVSAFC